MSKHFPNLVFVSISLLNFPEYKCVDFSEFKLISHSLWIVFAILFNKSLLTRNFSCEHLKMHYLVSIFRCTYHMELIKNMV